MSDPTTILKETFRQQYNRINTQILNEINPRDATETAICQTLDGQDIALKQGDVIANVINVLGTTKARYYIVLSTHENTGVTVYDLTEQWYTYYPADELAENLVETDTKIIKDLIPLTQKSEDSDSERLTILLENYDPREIPYMPSLPYGADKPLQITDEVEIKVGDVLYIDSEFEFILNTYGTTDNEPKPHHCVIKYNLDTGNFGFYPHELLKEDVNRSVWPEIEVLSDPWDIRG